MPSPRHKPLRSCIGCRAVRDKRELVRIVRTPEGRYELDPSGKLRGRGAYVCPNIPCVHVAIKKKSFDRAFRCIVPPETARDMEAALRAHLEGPAREEAVGVEREA